MFSKGVFSAIFVSVCASVMISCTKPENNTDKTPPILILTPAAINAVAGDQVKIDYTSTAVNGVKKIHIEGQYQSNAKIVLRDTSFANTRAADDEILTYIVPDTASTGQLVSLIFTITDGKGNSTSKTATVSITGSRPRIAVTPNKLHATNGDSISFTIDVSSTDKTLGTLTVGQNINNAGTTTISTFSYNAQNAIHQIYNYRIPVGSKSGDSIYLIFTATNNKMAADFVSKTITVD